MTSLRTDGGPEWPERLTRFIEWEWTAAEIREAAEEHARRHAAQNGLDEPLPAERWEFDARRTWNAARLKWARENGRMQDLVDAMVQRRIARRDSFNVEDE